MSKDMSAPEKASAEREGYPSLGSGSSAIPAFTRPKFKHTIVEPDDADCVSLGGYQVRRQPGAE